MNKILLFILCLVLTSCSNSEFCIKLEGSAGRYGIDDASVELCRNAAKSDALNAEVYTSNTGQDFVVVNTKYIERANSIIRQAKEKANGNNVESTAIESNCIKEFCTAK